MPTFSLHTLGCRANRSDSERIREILLSADYLEVPFGQPADCQIVNTCTVTHEADRKSRQMIRRAQKKSEGGIVIATGCAVAKRGGLKRWSSATIKLPPDELDRLVEVLGIEECPANEKLVKGFGQSRTRALLRVQEGCDQFCTFCIVPYVRGRAKSFDALKVLEKAKQFEAQGVQEIVLTGIHLSTWGLEMEPEKTLEDLLRLLVKETSGVRFRLSSVEPDRFPMGVVDLMKEYPDRICPHLHLVLQHSSDRILKRMHRGYDYAHYLSIVDHFKTHFPLGCLTSDVMVGFPGESEEDFEHLKRSIASLPFYHLHVFPYSVRPGTAASKFTDQIDPQTKSRRMAEILELAAQKESEFVRKCLGSKVRCIVEKQLSEGWVQGTSENYLTVKFKAGPYAVGRSFEILIEEKEGEHSTLLGEITMKELQLLQ